ncbi:helix-turn-helix domain-containing protein [Myroides injenensis]|uniref:helix-turn-helix domain-containing protein n=1 Tax=Myroides injenensis TaxID=1183151 RepID=UPI000288F70B|nr:helix-turn-helix transcriptional regulator [Myroides injenensis]
MIPQKKVIKVQQYDKNTPIEFYTIEDNNDLFIFDYHYQYNFYQIFWFTKVTSQHSQEIDFKTYPIIENHLWIIYPGQVQFFNPNGICGYYMAIDKDYFNRIIFQQLKTNLFKAIPPLHFAITTENTIIFKHLIELIKKEWLSKKRVDLLDKYLTLWLIHLQDSEILNDTISSTDGRLFVLLELIEANFVTHRSNVFYADKIALSVKRMNEILYLNTGYTLTQHIQQRLVLESKRLISYSNENIQTISNRLGFTEVNYFNRFFKKHTGQTPLDFRNNFLKVQ